MASDVPASASRFVELAVRSRSSHFYGANPNPVSMSDQPALSSPDRRDFLTYFSAIGLGTSLLPGVLWSKVAAGAEITKETIASAEEIAGVSFTDEERTMMVRNLNQTKQQIEALHKVTIDNGTPPAILFEPVPPGAT